MGVQLLQFVIGIAILIIVHELGHFMAARIFKIDIDEFGIGFPPRIVSLFSVGKTQITLNWIPLGGFVKIKGENDPDIPGGLASANPWVRIAVMFAGSFTNLITGIVLSVILFYNMGEPILDKVIVKDVSPESPAAIVGLQKGDIILEVNKTEIKSTDQLLSLIYANLGTPTDLVYQRDEQIFKVTLTPRNPPPEEGAIGIMMGYEMKPTTWAKAIPQGIVSTYQYIQAVLLLPVNLIQGEVSPEQARPLGYKGMFDIYQEIRNPIWFFMMITLSLGIFNLLPLPALDGGRILLTLPEIIIKRRVPPQYENMIHFVGFTLLLLLLIYINIQDFINPIQLPF